jgi:hypothetical protein
MFTFSSNLHLFKSDLLLWWLSSPISTIEHLMRQLSANYKENQFFFSTEFQNGGAFVGNLWNCQFVPLPLSKKIDALFGQYFQKR